MNNRLVVYWTDGLNSPRWLDLTDLEGKIVPGVLAPEGLVATVPTMDMLDFDDSDEPVTAVAFTWDFVDRAVGYDMFINGEQVNEDLITQEFFVYLGLPFGIHTAYVVASSGGMTSEPSEEVEFEIGPFPPQNFTASLFLGNLGNLAWEAGILAESYDVYRVVENGEDTKLNDDPIFDLAVELEMPAGVYDVYVVSVADGFKSIPSNTVALDVPLGAGFDQEDLTNIDNVISHKASLDEEGELEETDNTSIENAIVHDTSITEEGEFAEEGGTKFVLQAPDNLTANSDGSIVTLNWLGSAGAEGYNVYLNDGSGYTKYNTTLLTTASLVISDLADNIYYVYVTAVAEAEESAESNTEEFLIGDLESPANYNITLTDA